MIATLYDFSGGALLYIFGLVHLVASIIINGMIILIEAIVFKKMRLASFGKNLGMAFVLNLASATVGYLFAYVAHRGWLLFEGYADGSFAATLFWMPVLIISIPPPYNFLLLFFGYWITIGIEGPLMLLLGRLVNPEAGLGQLWKMTLVANIWSYLFLFTLYTIGHMMSMSERF